MLCKECDRPVVAKAPGSGLCRLHYDRYLAGKRLDELSIVECAGGCGKRVHNIAGLVLPGIVQGSGPGYLKCRNCAYPKPLKGRADFRGTKNGKSRFTEDNIRDIRKLSANGVSNSELAHKFGTTRGNIGKIVNRVRWVHI